MLSVELNQLYQNEIKNMKKIKQNSNVYLPNTLGGLFLQAGFLLNHKVFKEIYDDPIITKQIGQQGKFQTINQMFKLVSVSGKYRFQNSHITTILSNLSPSARNNLRLDPQSEYQQFREQSENSEYSPKFEIQLDKQLDFIKQQAQDNQQNSNINCSFNDSRENGNNFYSNSHHDDAEEQEDIHQQLQDIVSTAEKIGKSQAKKQFENMSFNNNSLSMSYLQNSQFTQQKQQNSVNKKQNQFSSLPSINDNKTNLQISAKDLDQNSNFASNLNSFICHQNNSNIIVNGNGGNEEQNSSIFSQNNKNNQQKLYISQSAILGKKQYEQKNSNDQQINILPKIDVERYKKAPQKQQHKYNGSLQASKAYKIKIGRSPNQNQEQKQRSIFFAQQNQKKINKLMQHNLQSQDQYKLDERVKQIMQKWFDDNKRYQEHQKFLKQFRKNNRCVPDLNTTSSVSSLGYNSIFNINNSDTSRSIRNNTMILNELG